MSEVYTEEYIERCFTVWYALNQPTNFIILQDALPESANGNKPGVATLKRIFETYGWAERADILNAKAVEKVETQLVDQRADMLKRQAESAFKVAKKAEEYLLESGFDTASSAVGAIRWASEEERTVRGVSEFMVKISRMPSADIIKEAAKLLKRNSEVIDLVVEEMNEEEVDESANIVSDSP